MPEIQYAVLCSHALIDSTSNNTSLIELIEEITFSPPPPLPPEDQITMLGFAAAVAVQWYRSKDEEAKQYLARITFVTKNGKRNHSVPLPIQLHISERARTIFRLGALPFDGFGQCYIEVEWQKANGSWVIASTIPLLMKQAETSFATKEKKPKKRSARTRTSPQKTLQ